LARLWRDDRCRQTEWIARLRFAADLPRDIVLITMRTTASALLCAFVSMITIACQDQPTSLLDGDGGSSSNGNNGGAGEGGSPTTSNGGSSSSGDGGNEPIPQTADFVITAAGSADIELRDSTDVSLTIAPNGYMGVVSLSLMNVPGDVDASVSPMSVTLDGTSDETVTVTVTSASNSESGAFAISVLGTVPEGQASGDVAVTIEPVITITIPQDLAGYASNPADTTAFGDYPTVIKAPANISEANPVTVKFFNDDTAPHEIHADQDGAGFGHGQGSIAPGSFDPVVRQVNQTGEFGYYPHDIGTTILGMIVIE
jgi:plastocyanin